MKLLVYSRLIPLIVGLSVRGVVIGSVAWSTNAAEKFKETYDDVKMVKEVHSGWRVKQVHKGTASEHENWIVIHRIAIARYSFLWLVAVR